MNPRAVMEMLREEECKFVDFKFMDFVGLWQHFSVPVEEFSEADLESGRGFDGSSIRGWQPSHAADMLVVPDPSTARIDPFPKARTLSLIGDIFDPQTREPYSRDPRHIARKAQRYLEATGLGDAARFGASAVSDLGGATS